MTTGDTVLVVMMVGGAVGLGLVACWITVLRRSAAREAAELLRRSLAESNTDSADALQRLRSNLTEIQGSLRRMRYAMRSEAAPPPPKTWWDHLRPDELWVLRLEGWRCQRARDREAVDPYRTGE